MLYKVSIVVLLFFCIVLLYTSLNIKQEIPSTISENVYVKEQPPDNFETFLQNTLDECIVQNVDFDQLIYDLTEYVIMPPNVPINDSCKAPSYTIDCNKYPDVFSGKLETPRKLGITIQFGFDLDVLEIALYQYYDIVDYIFIAESVRAHYKLRRKPLLWDRVKNTPRFSKFNDKVIHVIIDDIEMVTPNKNAGMWTGEGMQERHRFLEFMRWNEKNSYFNDDDLIGMGDTDEIPSLENLLLLKHCKLKDPMLSIDVGIWFPRETVDWAFRTDYPVSGQYPHSLGDPTFYSIKILKSIVENARAKNKTVSVTRARGASKKFLLGGMHMSDHNYLPFRFMKFLTCTECAGFKVKTCIGYSTLLRNNGIDAIAEYFEKMFHGQKRNNRRWVRVEKLSKKEKVLVQLPWFLECNRDRYPYNFGKIDERYKLQKY